MEFRYNVLIETPDSISNQEGRGYKRQKDLLEGMVFANPVNSGDSIYVDFKGDLFLGVVKGIKHFPPSKKPAYSEIFIKRNTLPREGDKRFPEFVEGYIKDKSKRPPLL